MSIRFNRQHNSREGLTFLLALCLLVVSPLALSAQVPSPSDSVGARRTQLEQELATLETEIETQRKILENKQRERVSLERDVAILNAKIEKAKLSIKARDIVIRELKSDIAGKEKTIVGLSQKLNRERQSLAQIIRRTNEIDSYSFAEVLLSGTNINSFFEDLDTFDSVKVSLRNSYTAVVEHRSETQTQKQSLEEKATEEVELRQIQELEKRRTEEQEAELKKLLTATKGLEATYQQIIANKEKSAAAIRAELFALRGSAAIPFERAYAFAMKASVKTGVRSALILGIIAEESNLGENVGTGNWQVDMKNPRDTVPFLDITRRLGLNPDNMPVSKKPWYGYGGAMGPAQFIPSTWILYEDRIAESTGHRPPNPWDPQDAFMAAALLLSDNGAAARTYNAERLAALRYFAGWANASKNAYAFYGDDVMELATKYQGLIDILERT
jgi:hypothetical protein